MTNLLQEGRQMVATVLSLAGAPSTASAGVDITTSIVQSVVVAGAFCQERLRGLSVRKGNFHVTFLGEGAAATSLPYPTQMPAQKAFHLTSKENDDKHAIAGHLQ